MKLLNRLLSFIGWSNLFRDEKEKELNKLINKYCRTEGEEFEICSH